jgi:hypothetical protein
MRRTLQIALLGIFLVSAIAGVVIGYLSVLRITDKQAAREVSIAHDAISAKFKMFDTLLGREEREMEARMAHALPVVAQRLLGLDRNFQRASDAELAALSKELGVDAPAGSHSSKCLRVTKNLGSLTKLFLPGF